VPSNRNEISNPYKGDWRIRGADLVRRQEIEKFHNDETLPPKRDYRYPGDRGENETFDENGNRQIGRKYVQSASGRMCTDGDFQGAGHIHSAQAPKRTKTTSLSLLLKSLRLLPKSHRLLPSLLPKSLHLTLPPVLLLRSLRPTLHLPFLLLALLSKSLRPVPPRMAEPKRFSNRRPRQLPTAVRLPHD
jgi:hypothetical protein